MHFSKYILYLSCTGKDKFCVWESFLYIFYWISRVNVFGNIISPRINNDYSQTIDNVYEKLEDYNPTKNRKVLIGDTIAYMDAKKNKVLSSMNCY